LNDGLFPLTRWRERWRRLLCIYYFAFMMILILMITPFHSDTFARFQCQI
jgi:hypothetical protein